MTGVTEKLLEDEISGHLVAHGGYLVCKVGNSAEHKADFDPQLGLDTAELFAFIDATQRGGLGEAGQGARRRRGARTAEVR